MSALLLIGLGIASAQDIPTCEPLAPLERETLSVAWVSPLQGRVFGNQWITVVPTADLQAWVRDQQADLGRLLQGLGLKKRYSAPAMHWKVTIFEVSPDDLCRPVEHGAPGDRLAGHVICSKGSKGVSGAYDGCGYTTDRADDTRGVDVFSLRWRDAAAAGFCVLPAERFLLGH